MYTQLQDICAQLLAHGVFLQFPGHLHTLHKQSEQENKTERFQVNYSGDDDDLK